MSLTSVLLPEPLTPVTTVMTPSGKRAVRFCRLWLRAPSTVIHLPVSGRGSSAVQDADVAARDSGR